MNHSNLKRIKTWLDEYKFNGNHDANFNEAMKEDASHIFKNILKNGFNNGNKIR